MFVYLAFLVSYASAGTTTVLPEPAGAFEWGLPSRGADTLAVGAWNVLHLTANRFVQNPKLAQHLCSVISQYDLISLLEIDEVPTLETLKANLDGFDYITSAGLPFNGIYKEAVAYFYRTSKVTPDPNIQHSIWNAIGPSPHKKDLNFRRPPYVAAWLTKHAQPARFITAAMHLQWGDGDLVPRSEVRLLQDVARSIARRISPEADVVLLGDFNLPPEEPEYNMLRTREGYTSLWRAPMKTTATNKSLLDNIWLSPSAYSTMYNTVLPLLPAGRGSYGMWNIWPSFPEYTTVNDAAKRFTDHRPLWVMLNMADTAPTDTRAKSLINISFEEPICGHPQLVKEDVPCALVPPLPDAPPGGRTLTPGSSSPESTAPPSPGSAAPSTDGSSTVGAVDSSTSASSDASINGSSDGKADGSTDASAVGSDIGTTDGASDGSISTAISGASNGVYNESSNGASEGASDGASD